MKRIVHLGYFHRFDDVRIVEKECATLNELENYELTYITSNRNCSIEDIVNNGIRIKVIPIINRRFIRLFVFIKDAYKEICKINPDVCHIHEFILLPIVNRLKKKNIKIIIDLHENDVEDRSKFFENRFGKLIGKLSKKILIWYEKKKVLQSNGVISVTPQIIDRVKVYGVNTILLPNYPLIRETPITKKTHVKYNKEIKICFAGGVYDIWNHLNIMKAMEDIDNIYYLIAGRIEQHYLEELKNNDSWNKTDYYGVIPHTDVINNIYPQCDVGMALLQYNVGWLGKDGTLGNTKLFEYMQAGLAVICTDFKLWREIIEKYNCGILVNPNDMYEIREALLFCLNNPEKVYEMGLNGRAAIENEYNWDIIKGRLLELYKYVIG